MCSNKCIYRLSQADYRIRCLTFQFQDTVNVTVSDISHEKNSGIGDLLGIGATYCSQYETQGEKSKMMTDLMGSSHGNSSDLRWYTSRLGLTSNCLHLSVHALESVQDMLGWDMQPHQRSVSFNKSLRKTLKLKTLKTFEIERRKNKYTHPKKHPYRCTLLKSRGLALPFSIECPVLSANSLIDDSKLVQAFSPTLKECIQSWIMKNIILLRWLWFPI